MMRRLHVLAVGLLLGALAVPVQARLVECEGRCEDGAGSAMVVTNRCDEASERCEAGCDTTGVRPQPYAECVEKAAAEGTRRDPAAVEAPR